MMKERQSVDSKNVEIDDIPTGVLLLSRKDKENDKCYCIEYVNQAATDILGLQSDELYRAEIRQVTPAKLLDNILPIWKKVAEGSTPKPVIKKIELETDEVRSYTVVVNKIKQGVLTLLHEVGDGSYSYENLRQIAKKYRAIFENTQDIFYQTSMDGEILEISPSVENFVGFKREDLIGRNVFSFYSNIKERKRFLDQLKKRGKLYDYEIKLKTLTGNLIHASNNAHLAKNKKGEVKIEGSLRDITKRKNTERELEVSNKQLKKLNAQKDKLFSVISHDLKNALAGPAGMYDIILEDFEDISRDQLYNYLVALNRSTNSALELLMDLLEWSKNQFQEIEPSFDLVDLQKIAEEAVLNIQPIINDKEVKIENNIVRSCRLMADYNMIKTVLRNLLSNAVKFSEREGKITIGAKKDEEFVTVSIRDEGVGMDNETKQKIFDKSINYTTKGTDGERGSGLGLDLVVDFIKIHNGEVWVDSELGKGSTFYFKLPVKLISPEEE